MIENESRWPDVVEFFRIKIEAAESAGDWTYEVWLRRLLCDLALHVQR